MARGFRDERLYERDGSRFIWARVADEHGRVRRVSTRCTDEKAAAAFADEWERKAADPGYRRASEATLGSAIADWLDHNRRKGMNARTYSIAEDKVGHFVRLWGEDWPLLRIGNELVLRYIDQREREPGARRGATVAPLTIKRELQHLVRVLKWAKFRGTFPLDLETIVPPDYSGKHKPKTRWPTPEEAVRLLMQLSAHRGAWVAFILATGARVSETFRACRSDVHLEGDNPYVAVMGSKTELATGTVPVTGLTHPFLIYALQHAPGDDPLFAPWNMYWRDIQAACVRAGIEPLSPNDLRRAYGKWHRLQGASAEEVSIMLRHATDRLAQTTYARISGADIGHRMRSLAPVPEPYAETAEPDPNSPNAEHETCEKAAPSRRIERPTNGLGNLTPPDASTIRSHGTKLGLARTIKH